MMIGSPPLSPRSETTPRPSDRSSENKGPTLILVECLSCHHCSTLDACALRLHGETPATSLVTLSQRLVCRKCGSRALKVERR